MYERQFQQQHSATLTYNKSFIKKHNLDAMIGGEYFDYNRFKLQAKGNKAPSDDIPTLNGSSDKTEVYSYKDGYRMLSGFAVSITTMNTNICSLLLPAMMVYLN